MREVSCLGRCDIAPAATVEEQPVRAADVAAVEEQASVGESARRGAAAAGPNGGTPTPRTWPNDPYAGTPEPAARYASVARCSPAS